MRYARFQSFMPFGRFRRLGKGFRRFRCASRGLRRFQSFMPFGRFRRFGALRAVSGGFKVSCPSDVSGGFRRYAGSRKYRKGLRRFQTLRCFRKYRKGFRRFQTLRCFRWLTICYHLLPSATLCNPLQPSATLCNPL